MKESHALGAAGGDISTLVAHPAASSALGLILGVALALIVWAGVRRITPDDPVSGMVQAAALNVLAMLAGLSGLMAFFVFARGGLIYFGIGLVFAFIATAVVRFWRAGRAQSAH